VHVARTDGVGVAFDLDELDLRRRLQLGGERVEDRVRHVEDAAAAVLEVDALAEDDAAALDLDALFVAAARRRRLGRRLVAARGGERRREGSGEKDGGGGRRARG